MGAAETTKSNRAAGSNPQTLSGHLDGSSDSVDWFLRGFAVLLAVGGFAILIHAIRLLTATIETAKREQLFGGFQWFVATVLIAVGTVILLTVCIKACVALFGAAAVRSAERRRLKSATRRAHHSINRKQELLEERIRLAAQLRATWMFERESFRLANVQARREFQEALQTSVTRSCELSFEQIGLVITQYESALIEIEQSQLDHADKAQLLEQLSNQLSIAATEEKNRSAERLMEDEIWKLRFETAGRLKKKSRQAALRYLVEVETATQPCPQRRKLQAMIRRLKAGKSAAVSKSDGSAVTKDGIS